jgi:hypothetical protein
MLDKGAHRIGFYAWQEIGFPILDLLETGGIVEEIDGKVQVRVKIEGGPDMIYKQKDKVDCCVDKN